MIHLNPWRLAVLLSGSRGEFVDVSFVANHKLMHAMVPSNELWITIKDVLVIEEYELDKNFRLGSISPDSTIVDAGAFVGLYSLKVSRYARRVIALEPSRRNYSILAHNLAKNSISNIQANQLALSSRRGRVLFKDVETHSSSSLSDDKSNKAYEVESTTLDDVIQDYGPIDLLKMDIEGAEYEVMLSVSSSGLKKVNKIVAEVHISSPDDYHRFAKVVGRLHDSGMSMRVLKNEQKSLHYGLTRPWRCSLRRLNGRSALPYRLLISSIYGLSPILSRLKWSYDERPTPLLFGFRD